MHTWVGPTVSLGYRIRYFPHFPRRCRHLLPVLAVGVPAGGPPGVVAKDEGGKGVLGAAGAGAAGEAIDRIAAHC